MKPLVLLCVAAIAVGCSGVPESPTAATSTALDMAAPSAGAAAFFDSGSRAIGPELQSQSCSQERSLRATATSVRTAIEFVNLTGSIKSLYWIGYNGERYLFSTMLNGWSYTFNTYLTHPWVVADDAGTCIALYLPVAEPSTATIRSATAPLSAAMIASTLATEINRSFIAAMQSADVPALVQTRAGVANCSGGGSVRVQHLGPAPGGGRVSLNNTPAIFSGCTHLLGGRSIVASGTLFANGFWSATEPTSPVRIAGDLEVEGLPGPIGIDGVTGAGFDGRIGGVGVQPGGPPDTAPPPNPPSPGIAKYDGAYDLFWTYPTGNGTSSSQTVRRFWIVRNGVISSTDGAIAGTVDGSGYVRFTFRCTINNSLADFKGNLDWTAPAGANHGEGTYECRMPISGNLTWRVDQR